MGQNMNKENLGDKIGAKMCGYIVGLTAFSFITHLLLSCAAVLDRPCTVSLAANEILPQWGMV